VKPEPSEYPTQQELARDPVRAVLGALVLPDLLPFDQILWDPILKVLSFRCYGVEYINMWLETEDFEKTIVERNGGPATNSEILWELP
jgi:hypothetical protein